MFLLIGLLKVTRQPRVVYNEMKQFFTRYGLEPNIVSIIGIIEIIGGASLLIYWPSTNPSARASFGFYPVMSRAMLVILTGSAVAFHVSMDDKLLFCVPAVVMFMCSLILFISVL